MDEIIKRQLHEMEIQFTHKHDEARDIYIFDLDISNGMVKGIIGLSHVEKCLFIFFRLPTPLPQKRTSEILEFINRVNNEHSFGTFVYDFEDYIVGYQTSFFIEQEMPSFEHLLKRSFELAIDNIDLYLPALLSVAFGSEEPSAALNQLEFQIDPRLN